MRFLIISHATHKKESGQLYAYAPYVREMNLWLKYVDSVEIVAPLVSSEIGKIDLAYRHTTLKFTKIPEISLTSVVNMIRSLFLLPFILYRLFGACRRADHIHLRCPGNIGLLGCFVQIFFPSKVKTAKYAGNWDPKARQPRSYRLQKYILSHTALTKNMTVLVYGQWKNQTRNIRSFFTATFKNDEKIAFRTKDYTKKLRFLSIGSLVEGKRPLLGIQIIEALQKKGVDCSLDLFGDGVLRPKLEAYISEHDLEGIHIHGNETKETIKSYLETSHFLILASKSEGWPKVLAEAMFYGVIPISTRISCVPFMLGEGGRGILIEPNLGEATQEILNYLKQKDTFEQMSKNGLEWSQHYTLDYFESEIKKLLQN